MLELLPFADEHLDAAGELLAARHRRHRQAEPLLPERFEDPAEARVEVAALWAKEGASGVVALRAGRAVGYLIGTRLDDSWGPNTWVEYAGHAVDEPETVRELYAAAAARWFEDGRRAHYAWVPASDGALVDAWFRLAFGHQHTLAMREVAADGWPKGVREAVPEDVDGMVALAPVLPSHQLGAPTFALGAPHHEDEEAVRKEILEEIANPAFGNLVAEQDGRLVGHLIVVPLELSSSHTGLARPEHIAFIGYAVTSPEVRGSGAGRALTQASYSWARERGHEAIAADWRETNLLASRFWPRRGFRPTFLRLHRLIGY
jgi:GNAT superfamily N-acetyltransferase